jgi:hypothetical protein
MEWRFGLISTEVPLHFWLALKSLHITDFGHSAQCPRSPRARCRGLAIPGHGHAPWPALLAAGRTTGWGWPRSPPRG